MAVAASTLSRRAFLSAAMTLPVLAPAHAAPGLAAVAPFLSETLLARALDALARHHHQFWSRDIIGIADFGLSSTAARLHLVDLLEGRVTSIRVAHGKGSDPEHKGMLQSFSNLEGSLATSEGAYVTGETYSGKYGVSRRLIGLDETNNNAERRAIVIHSAWYAAPDVLNRQPVLGRSDGCFAVAPQDLARLITTLGRGRLLYAGRG